MCEALLPPPESPDGLSESFHCLFRPNVSNLHQKAREVLSEVQAEDFLGGGLS